MSFYPEEVLFLPTTDCNLACPHCTQKRSKVVLSKGLAVKFLQDCRKNNIKKVGFTGGEPFLVGDFLLAIVREALRNDMFFDRIMTNASWFRSEEELRVSLARLHAAGYDGSISVSVDEFHAQDPEKVAFFIKEAVSIFERKDIISIAYVDSVDRLLRRSACGGPPRNDTKSRLTVLAKMLGGRLVGFDKKVTVTKGDKKVKKVTVTKGDSHFFTHPHIVSKDIFIRISRIELSPVGRAGRLKDPWDGKWFKEDRCKGPGNVFLVMPNGDVKPCCGYASDLKALTIGNINRDGVKKLIANAKKNKFVNTVFGKGLTSIRRRLESSGVKFPGKTSNHCYFCYYILTHYQ